MNKQRGTHPDELLFSEAKLQWRAQDAVQKDYERGTLVEEIQKEMPLNAHIRGNVGLPIPSQDPQEALKTPPSSVQTPEQDPNLVYGGVRSKSYGHFSHTIAGQYQKAALKIAEQHWLDANGHPETTRIKDPSKRLRRRLGQKLHPEHHQKRPKLLLEYKRHAQERYSQVKDPYSHILYLRNDCFWNFDDIALRLGTSPSQAEWCYTLAQQQHIIVSAPCPPHLTFKKPKNPKGNSLRL